MNIYIFDCNGGDFMVGVIANSLLEASMLLPPSVSDWDSDVEKTIPLMTLKEPGVLFILGEPG